MIRRLLLNTHIGMMLLLTLATSSRGALASDFTLIPPSDPIYTQLQTIRNAPWTSSWATTGDTATETSLTRYELALETAKSLISLRARHNADAGWIHTVSPESLHAIRQLCVALQSELPQFNVDVPATLKLIDGLLLQTQTDEPLPVVAAAPSTSMPTPSLTLAKEEHDSPSLSQRLRVYSALDSLARQANDPFRADSSGVQRLRVGASYDLSDSLRLRGELEKEDRQRPAGLRDFLAGTSLDTNAQNTREIEASATWTLRPGLTFSGGVAHIDSANPLSDGLRFESSLGLTGWQNRVALSAHLSRLMPEDSLALSQTAARLNLGVGLTSQIQLKLMYQQLFGATYTGQDSRRFGGGLDFSF